ncbi:hypothetical protein [Lactobacillus helveticus]|uniref:Uncharacterized protein n=2 Tax=Lactobacillus helveticus TaxID=1587 RepID=A0A2X0P9G8_LACHE|nr:hypothetical protein [Lactobacillus helveticus]EGF36171.1 hypothetical protein AAULH_08928 [Lactobacillus helveticus MTCC 5463]AGQ23892.1 hypothetical protein lhe_1437 [Lactobacillus helveticus CNRZ32]EEW67227.1 hypothetical protein HMPREF0518_1830 [Lactobacillus helveticus DSM 20075 = CGMCC 1.1877]MDG9731147.1 hypothetical protein [Lactobacillus helveticus DSM 20075 = CGMCC 1.1877]CDI59523.1 Putative uncharacterized protein [Lactobacillus helveticus CIRM-BIA 104]
MANDDRSNEIENVKITGLDGNPIIGWLDGLSNSSFNVTNDAQ